MKNWNSVLYFLLSKQNNDPKERECFFKIERVINGEHKLQIDSFIFDKDNCIKLEKEYDVFAIDTENEDNYLPVLLLKENSIYKKLFKNTELN